MAENFHMPEIKKELLSLPDLSRRRTKSDATQYKQHRRSSQVPEITVEDCSDTYTDLEVAESLDHFDIHLTEPIRPRANTCPENIFKRIKDRPATPPPLEGKKLTWKELSRSPSKEKVSFAPHKLTKVSEDSEFTLKYQASSNAQRSTNITRPSSVSRTVGLSECG